MRAGSLLFNSVVLTPILFRFLLRTRHFALRSSRIRLRQFPATFPMSPSVSKEVCPAEGPTGPLASQPGSAPAEGRVDHTSHAQDARPVQDFVVIELFAGSGNLSKAFRNIGVQVVPVDTKDAPQIKIVKLNLLHERSVGLVMRLLETKKVLLVHMAPPCSTSSQARSIRRNKWDPQPLRSWDHPDGLLNLGFLNRTRVSQANKLYRLCVNIAVKCQTLRIWWRIENPAGSYMWVTSPFMELWRTHVSAIRFATFRNCVYGGDRKKSTTFWTACDALTALSCTCQKEYAHVHKEWGKQVDGTWATSQEAAYPPGLCSQYASLVLQAGQAAGMTMDVAAGQHTCSRVHLSLRQTGIERASQGLFPRGSQMPPLVDPFPNKVWHKVPARVDRSAFVPGKRITQAPFVKGATTLSVSEHDGNWWALVGLPVQPEEFLRPSGASVRPECHKPILPAMLEHAVDRYCSLDTVQLSQLRVRVLKGMIQRSQELAAEEKLLHAKLEPHARDVLKGKRLLLFQELLSCMNF